MAIAAGELPTYNRLSRWFRLLIIPVFCSQANQSIEVTMEAIQVRQFGGPEVLELQSVADPVPAEGQVLVSVKAAGVNPVDTYIRAGQYARKPALPYTPGIDAAGVVAALGAGVEGIQLGDRVYGGWPSSGTYAQQALYASHQLYPLPPPLSFAQGASIFVPYSTAYRSLFLKGQARPGQTLLVHGATGAVGLAAVQLGVGAGLRVVGTGGTAAGRELVLAQGAEAVFDHRAEGYLETIADLGGVDIVLEMLADVNLAADLQLLNSGGRVVIIGSRGRVEITPRDIMGREAIVTGMTLFQTPSAEMREIQAALGAGLRQGTLTPVIAKTYPLRAAAMAHRQQMESGAAGNRVLLPEEAAVPYSNE